MAASDDLLNQMATQQQQPGAPQPSVDAMPSTAPPAASDQLLDQAAAAAKARQDTILNTVAQRNPDKNAEAVSLSKEFGLDMPTVLKNQDELARMSQMKQASQVLAASPFLAWQMQDPNFASISYDDTHNLAAVGNVLRSPFESVKALGLSTVEAARGVNSMLSFIPAMIDKIHGGNEASTWWQEHMLAKPDQSLQYSPQSGVAGRVFQALGSAGGLMSQATLTGPGAEEDAGVNVARSAYDWLTRTAPHAVRTMAFPALTSAASTAHDVYHQTLDPVQAAKAGIAQFESMAAMGLAPLAAPGSLATRLATGAVSGAAIGEGTREFMNANLPATMQQPFSASDLFTQMVTGSLMGGAMGPREADFVRATKAARAVQDSTQLQQLTNLARASKVLPRSGEAFQKFVDDAAQDGPVDTVYIDANTLKQSGVGDEVAKLSPSVAEQLPEALATGGDVSIPVGEYAAKIAPTKYADALLDHIKTDPEGYSRAEAELYLQTHAGEMQQEAEQLAAQQENEDGFKQSTDAVRAEVKRQLDKVNHFTPKANDAYAAMMSSYFATQAAHLGVLPEDLYQQYAPRISSEMFGAGGLAQAPAADGPFGPVFTEYHHDAQGAVERLLNEKTGEVPGALYHPEIGDIDLVYGKAGTGSSDGYGLAKIAEHHPEVLDDLQNIIAGMHVASRSRNRVMLESETHKGGVRLTWDGEAKHWLLTAFEKEEAADGAQGATVSQGVTDGGLTQPSPSASGDSIESDLKDFYQSRRDELRGAYSPDSRTISLLKNADLSTFLHESGHFFLDTHFDMATKLMQEAEAARTHLAEGQQQIVDDAHALLKWFGVEDLAAWNKLSLEQKRDAHEKFAEGFERYLFEGKAPSVELHRIFARFRSWLLNIYRQLATAPGADLSDEVRGVMGRMLATNDQILAAEHARGMVPLFSDKPEGMSSQDWEQYQRMGSSAAQEAVNELQTRGLRDMKWLGNARSKVIRDLQKQADAKRREMRAEVSDAVKRRPVYRAAQFLKYGKLELPDDAPQALRRAATEETLAGTKLSLPRLKEMFGDGPAAPWRYLPTGKNGMAAAEGIDPDLAAEMFGFQSGRELVHALVEAAPLKDEIEAVTDQRMLEQYGDLSSPEEIARAADEAIHNKVRARMVATEFYALTKATGGKRVLHAAAKEQAARLVARTRVGELRPSRHAAADARAGRAADRAFKAGDVASAANEKRKQLVQTYATKNAYDAQRDVEKTLSYLKKFGKPSIRKKLDPDMLEQVDDLLARFDLRKYPLAPADKKPQQLRDYLEAQRLAGYSPVISPDMIDAAVRMPYKQMTVEQLRGLHDTVRSLEHMAREKRQITVEGKKMATDAVVGEMLAKLDERGQKFSDEYLAEGVRKGVDPAWRYALDRMGAALRSSEHALLPQHFKANIFDMHEILGPFRRYLFEPILDANYKWYDYQNEVAQILKEREARLGADWQKSLNEVVDNHNLMDNALEVPAKRRLTRRDFIGMALHVGNESNFEKLTKGMQWDPAEVWQTVMDNLRAEDWEAVKLLGRIGELHWEDQVEMNHELGNTTPEKIQPRPFMTPHGEMPGWYAHITYDPNRSKLAIRQEEARTVNPADGNFGPQYYRASTTTNGSLNERVGSYYDFVSLDPNDVERATLDGLRDLAYRRALIDARKIVMHLEFRRQFMRAYGREAHQALQTWLGRLVNARVIEQDSNKLIGFLRSTRRAMVANGIALRLSTIGKHGGSAAAKSAAYFIGGGQKYWLRRATLIATQHGDQVAEALAKFGEIRARYAQQDRDFRRPVSTMFDRESAFSKAERFGHSFVANADFLTAVPTALAAYDWAITEGIPERLGGTGKPMSEAEAIHFANGMVREAHGSNIEATRSNIINNPDEMMRWLTMLYNFMNNSFGQNLDMIDKLRQQGFSKPEVLGRYMLAMLVPAIVAGAVSEGIKDGESWWQWFASAVGSEYAGMVPVVREGYDMVVKGYDTAGMPPWFRALSEVAKPVQDLAKRQAPQHPIKDTGNAVGLVLPGLGQFGATTQYLYDVHAGKQQPETVGDWVRGIMSGSQQQR